MLKKLTLRMVPVAVGLLFLGACATTSNSSEKGKPISSEKVAEAQSVKKVADELTQTRTTAKSEDGKLICKRTAVIGSNFKRKVCATAEEWEARSAQDKKTTEGIQRSQGPGVNN